MWKTVKRRCGAWLFGWVSPALLGFLDTWIRPYLEEVLEEATVAVDTRICQQAQERDKALDAWVRQYTEEVVVRTLDTRTNQYAQNIEEALTTWTRQYTQNVVEEALETWVRQYTKNVHVAIEAWANQYTQDVVVKALREYEWRQAGRAVCDCPIRYVDLDGQNVAGQEVIASRDRTHKRTFHGKTYATCRQDADGYWVYRAEE